MIVELDTSYVADCIEEEIQTISILMDYRKS